MKNTHNKLWALLVALIALVALCAFAASAEVVGGDCSAEGSNVSWSYDTETKVLTISGTGAMASYALAASSGVQAPWASYRNEIQTVQVNEGVVTIGEGAFSRCSALEHVNLPDGLINIRAGAFEYCTSLKTIYIPARVSYISDKAFFYCPSRETLAVAAENASFYVENNCIINRDSKEIVLGCNDSVIPDDGSVTSIGAFAFNHCETMESFVVPNTVARIGSSAFQFCGEMKSIIIPESVTEIGSSAFVSCTSLLNVEIPSGVTIIKESTFNNCRSLASVVLLGNVTSIGTRAFMSCVSLSSIILPNSVTEIGTQAFEICTSLPSITIPENVISIGETAFGRCSALPSITIPASVTSIGKRVVEGCTSMETIEVAAENTVYHSDGNCIIETDAKKLIAGCKTSEIPSDGSVVSIGESAFSIHSTLESIEIPNSVTTIGNRAFYSCGALESIVIPDSVISIEDGAFISCTHLKTVRLGLGVESIGASAFYTLYIGDQMTDVLTCKTQTEFEQSVTLDLNWNTTNNSTNPQPKAALVYGAHVGGTVHNENVDPSTCTVPGQHDEVSNCIYCGVELRETVPDPLADHTPGPEHEEGRVEPTCTTKGSYNLVVRCTVCQAVITSTPHEIPAAHTPDEAVEETTPSTCTQAGYVESVVYCAVCDEELSREKIRDLDLADHTPGEPEEENRVEPTCTTKGSYNLVVRCAVCRTILSSTPHEIPAAHTPDEAVEETTPSTCTQAGYVESVVYCAVCDEELSREKIRDLDLADHTPGEPEEENRVEPTCTTKGSYNEVVRCTVCQTVITSTPHEIDMLPHTEAAPVQEIFPPTCTEAGHTDTVVYCSVCHTELSREVEPGDPALGHEFKIVSWKWANDNKSVTVTFECVRCHIKETATFDDIEVIKDPDTGAVTYIAHILYNNQTFTLRKTVPGDYRCGMCNFYDKWHDTIVFGWFVTFIHNFVHMAAMVGNRT